MKPMIVFLADYIAISTGVVDYRTKGIISDLNNYIDFIFILHKQGKIPAKLPKKIKSVRGSIGPPDEKGPLQGSDKGEQKEPT